MLAVTRRAYYGQPNNGSLIAMFLGNSRFIDFLNYFMKSSVKFDLKYDVKVVKSRTSHIS